MQHQITESNGHGKLTDRLTTYVSAANCVYFDSHFKHWKADFLVSCIKFDM